MLPQTLPRLAPTRKQLPEAPVTFLPEELQRIHEHAYRLWDAEGRPEGRALQHWVAAEANYRAPELGGWLRQLPAYAFAPPSPEDVALDALAAFVDLERVFRKALEQLVAQSDRLAAEVGPDTAEDAREVLRDWLRGLDRGAKAGKCAEAFQRLLEWGPFGEAEGPPAERPTNGVGLDGPEQEEWMDTEVRKLMAEARQQFHQDLRALLDGPHNGQWVAYRGKDRLGFGESKTRLLQDCYRDYRDEELFVAKVQPELPTPLVRW